MDCEAEADCEANALRLTEADATRLASALPDCEAHALRDTLAEAIWLAIREAD